MFHKRPSRYNSPRCTHSPLWTYISFPTERRLNSSPTNISSPRQREGAVCPRGAVFRLAQRAAEYREGGNVAQYRNGTLYGRRAAGSSEKSRWGRPSYEARTDCRTSATCATVSGATIQRVLRSVIRSILLHTTRCKPMGSLLDLGPLPAVGDLASAHITHEHFCCNRRSAATTGLRPAGSPLGPLPHCTSTHRGSGLRALVSRRGSAISPRTVMNNMG